MMIIKTPRSRLTSTFDHLLTALAWGAFAFLCLPGLRSILASTAHAATNPGATDRLLSNAQTLVAYALVSALIGLLLSAWACYNALRFGGLTRRQPLSDPLPSTLAEHFSISPRQLHILRTSQAVVIHHTDEGLISLVDFSHGPNFSDNVLQMNR
ncbi:MAG: poly-beta-1,6-N-acetyl-D-glucosamine biosynthesis protein PgaD [Castellaniella sp.]|uniref:poly-beta-1,6-N-acetyl-D-glucosamine biosynthesis protein PgaD n=1 Tax=Castellaniella sp. TaxID=1955812 RepID=UPI003A853168